MNIHLDRTMKSMGYIYSLKDGIADVLGMNRVQVGELLLAGVNYGLTLNLLRFQVGVTFLSEHSLRVGSFVKRLFQLINVFVTKQNSGRVVNCLGYCVSLYKKSIRLLGVSRKVEIKAPGILNRQSVYESLMTGVIILDALVPVGLGQRELIIGDRQTGKTAIAIDSILMVKERSLY